MQPIAGFTRVIQPHQPRLIKGKISSTVVHVSIKATNSAHPNSRTNFDRLELIPRNYKIQNQSRVDTSRVKQVGMIDSKEISKPGSYLSPSKNTNRSKESTLPSSPDTWANHADYVNKKDEKKTKKCFRTLIITGVLVTAIAIVTIIVLLVLFLIKSSKSTTNIPTPTLRWNTTGITLAGSKTGIPGTNNSYLQYPAGLALGDNNTLYISDSNNHRVQKYLPDASIGITVAGYPNATLCLGSNCLNYPLKIDRNLNESLYIADTANHRVQFWANGATSGTTVAGITMNPGSANNQVNWPHGLCFDSSSNTLYVADYYNQRIMKYSSGNTTGTLVAGGNGNGTSTTQLSTPITVQFDSFSNSLLIVNVDGHNVVRWVLGDTHWTLIAGSTNGSSGNSPTLLFKPGDVSVDPMGNIYIADSGNDRIQFFSAGSSTGTTIAGSTSVIGSNSTLLNRPGTIKLDNQLNLYVVDTYNHRIQKFMRY